MKAFPMTDDDITGNYHRGNPRSTEAHESVREHTEAQRKRIVEYIRKCGSVGATCDETEIALGMSHQSCSARFSELKRDSAIIVFSQRPTRSGRNADVFVIPAKPIVNRL